MMTKQGMIIKQAMVLAAGQGTRLRPLTNNTPKPLVTIDGYNGSCLSHVLDHLTQQKFDRIVVNAYYLSDQIVTFVRDTYPHVIVSVEPEPLETAGGFLHAAHLFSDAPVLIVNADTYIDYDAYFNATIVLDAFDPAIADFLLCIAPVANGIGYQGQGDYTFSVSDVHGDTKIGDAKIGDPKNGDTNLTDVSSCNSPRSSPLLSCTPHIINYRPANADELFVFTSYRVTTVAFMRSCAQLIEPEQGKSFSFKACFDIAESRQRLRGCLINNQWCDLSTPAVRDALIAYLS